MVSRETIVKGLEIVNAQLAEIAAGNLDITVEVDTSPELIDLSTSINQMTASIKQQIADIKEQNEHILDSLKYARKIQHHLLPLEKTMREVFTDYNILWEPKDIVGGDIYWTKKFAQGTVVCVCDCTGHGTPGALLTMLVVTILEAIVDEVTHNDPAEIVWRLDQHLISILRASEESVSKAEIKDGADLILMYIGHDNQIKFSSAKMHLFVCDGSEVTNIKGQKITIGDGSIKGKNEIETVTLESGENKAYYVASDGLFDQVGGEHNIPYGYHQFKDTILEYHDHNMQDISEKVWQEFETYTKGECRRDDITMLSFRL